ncbi:uncharacterized protein [Argopecten irradians]|uniref:uncharacterized protein n=1 Tax=Argopecten irradians TaxID=31199 RepID=UPI0037203CBD
MESFWANPNVLLVVLVSTVEMPSYCIPMERDLYCDPMEHKYYRAQFGVCGDCDMCLPGDEVIPPDGVNLGFGLHGATLCLGCQPCKKGTFNSDEDLKWYCSPCTKCSDLGLVEVYPCTPTQDTTCDVTTPISIRSISTKDNGRKSPFKGSETEDDDDRLYTMFLAITALSVTFLVIVGIVAYTLWRKLHSRSRVKTEESLRLYVSRDRDARVGEESTLQDIDEEEDGGDIFPPKTPYTNNYKRQRTFSQKTGEVNEPLLRRRQSLQPIRQTNGQQFKRTSSISGNKIELVIKEKPANTQSSRVHRRQSLPITDTEKDSCKSSFHHRSPSNGFIRYLSKLLAGDRAYRTFAKEVGLKEYDMKSIETEFGEKNKPLADVSYEIITRVLQIKPGLRIIDIYDILNRLGFQNERQLLEENIMNFKIPLT